MPRRQSKPRPSKPRPSASGQRRLGSKRKALTLADDADPRPRLQKVLAAAGLGSRRQAEELITEGRVEVDRSVVKKLGTRVDPVQQEIRVDGEPLPRPKRQYFMLHKPMGVVSTARDPAGRPRVTDLVKSHQRLFPIGRLDISSEGLILVTNDGELANLLAHPRYEVEKTYQAQVVGVPSREALAKLEHGVHLAEGYAHAKRVRIKSHHKQSSTLEIVLDEGRNREVRRLLARVGHKVLRLKRIAIGSLRLGNLAAGEYRPLLADEVRELKESALAAHRRDKREPQERKKAAPAERVMTPLSSAPVAMEEELITEGIDDFNPPRRPGTLIGNDDAAPPAVTPNAPLVRPLIDVRRGIFPGRQTDDFDDDELDELPIARPAAPRQPATTRPERPRRATQKRRPHGKGSSSSKPTSHGRGSSAGKPTPHGRGLSSGKPPGGGKGPKRPDRRKGRRR